MFELRWHDELHTDVDLRVHEPGDPPDGYSNKGGQLFDLLRDDLGHLGDATELNYEIAFSRGAPAGDYTVNLHLYRNNAGVLPVPAIVVVSSKPDMNASMRPIATRRVRMEHLGQELTVVRFSLDRDGRLVPGSIHDLARGLRSRKL